MIILYKFQNSTFCLLIVRCVLAEIHSSLLYFLVTSSNMCRSKKKNFNTLCKYTKINMKRNLHYIHLGEIHLSIYRLKSLISSSSSSLKVTE